MGGFRGGFTLGAGGFFGGGSYHRGSSSKNPGGALHPDWILTMDPIDRCPGVLSALETLVVQFGPKNFDCLYEVYRWAEDCPNMPPSVAEIGIAMRREKESLRKSSDESDKVEKQT